MKNMPGQGHEKDKDHDKNKHKGKEKADAQIEHKSAEQLHQRGEKLAGLSGRMARIAELSRELERNTKALEEKNAKKASQHAHSKEQSQDRSQIPPHDPIVEFNPSSRGASDAARMSQAEQNLQNIHRGAKALQQSLHEKNQQESNQQQHNLRQQSEDIEKINRIKLAQIADVKLNDRKIHEFSRIINIGIKSLQNDAVKSPSSPDIAKTLETLAHIQQKTADQVAACISRIPKKSDFFQPKGELPKDAWKNFLTALIEILDTAIINDPSLKSHKTISGIYQQIQQELTKTSESLQHSAVPPLLPPTSPSANKK